MIKSKSGTLRHITSQGRIPLTTLSNIVSDGSYKQGRRNIES